MEYKQKSLPPEGINNPKEKVIPFLIKSLGMLGVILLVLYVSSYFIPEILVSLTPKSVESKIGDLALKVYSKKTSKPDEELKKIWAEIKESLPESFKGSELLVMDSSEENAFALPGGKVFVTRGFLNKAESFNEKVFVLAHELGHQYYRHPLKSIYNKALSSAALSLITGSDDISKFMLGATSLSFSRSQETEADFFALDLVQKVSGNSKGAFSFFKRMAKKQGGIEMLQGEIFSTHPLSQKRVDYLEAECSKKFREENCS